MNIQTLMILEVLEFFLCAALIVAVVKIPRLRNRVMSSLNLIMSYLSGYFRSVQTVNVPDPNYRQQLIQAAVTGMLANPNFSRELDIKAEAEAIADKVLYVAPEENEEENDDEEHDGEPNYDADDDSEETENFN
jgi:hypothetical protein